MRALPAFLASFALGCASHPRPAPTVEDDLAQLKREVSALFYRARQAQADPAPIEVLASQVMALEDLGLAADAGLGLSEEESLAVEAARREAAAKILFERSRRLRLHFDRAEWLARRD